MRQTIVIYFEQILCEMYELELNWKYKICANNNIVCDCMESVWWKYVAQASRLEGRN